ncbi:MAG: hypothetical protein AB8B91_21750, partial [Rubripirellula sp.]
MTTGDSAASPSEQVTQSETAAPAESSTTDSQSPATSAPSANAEESQASKIARSGGPLAARGIGVAKPASPTVDPAALKASAEEPKPKKKKTPPRPRVSGDRPLNPKRSTPKPAAKVSVPNRRDALPDDIQAELDAELAAADVDAILGGSAGMADRKGPLEDGTRVSAQVIKIHGDSVFFGLGGPDEGVIPFIQFETEPEVGGAVEVIVRGINR